MTGDAVVNPPYCRVEFSKTIPSVSNRNNLYSGETEFPETPKVWMLNFLRVRLIGSLLQNRDIHGNRCGLRDFVFAIVTICLFVKEFNAYVDFDVVKVQEFVPRKYLSSFFS